MTNEEFERDLEELSSAEDFLCYFGVDFDPQVEFLFYRTFVWLGRVGEPAGEPGPGGERA